ncbi:type VI secretion system protein ImpB [Pseudomonas grimontii]|nr:type VI secretion system protein ImpB [Pseudomonas grimontii]
MPNDRLPGTPASLARDGVHISYLPIPPLDRLMWLRNALVALNGPLAGEPGLRENLQQHLFNEETDNRVLGKLNPPVTS